MKLITLNIWGGQFKELLTEFFAAHRDVNFFCLQEVNHRALHKSSTDDNPVCLNILDEISAVLPEHNFFFRPTVNNTYGLAMFVKKNIEIVAEGEVIIHDNPTYPGAGPTHSRNLQWMQCKDQGKEYCILNIHCLWNGAGKGDSAERIEQSHRAKAFLNSLQVPKILSGDFNLRPDTMSISILEDNMDNLVKRFGIQSTRTSLYPKAERFADYILTSSGVLVNDFKVLPDEVSDHSPLFLDFSVL
ncbi:MAG: endonuclease/exonuclease/phosphatase family protein [Gammaproteobacteria bacterium]|nr:endonuclease/exonuclease/phosphatase family protein [Gammaproteobacteria bacterium]